MGFPLSKRCHRSLWWLCDLSLVQYYSLGGVIEPRLGPDHGAVKPNNVLLVLVGAGIPWISCNEFTAAIRTPRTLEEVLPCLTTLDAAAS